LPITIANMVVTLTMWYDAWRPPLEFGTVLNVAFAAKFRSFVYAALPPAFVPGFKRLIRFTLDPASATWSTADPTDPLDPGVVLPQGLVDNTIWDHFEVLGLVERHEALVHNVMHEYIEQHVHAAYAGSEQWAEQTLPKLYSWTKANLVPWMFHPFARGAQNCGCLPYTYIYGYHDLCPDVLMIL
jgi:anaphase-promoting complex subunit 2